VSYLLLKSIHLSAVILSGTLFFTRGLWMLRGSPRLQQTWVKVVPHIIDTVLLASAIALTLRIQQYPFTHDWLTAKVLGLLLYIVLGMIALKRGRSRRVRLLAWLTALAVFLYIVAVAVTHDALIVTA
jgi:uncharacterized membrane protein SirB2